MLSKVAKVGKKFKRMLVTVWQPPLLCSNNRQVDHEALECVARWRYWCFFCVSLAGVTPVCNSQVEVVAALCTGKVGEPLPLSLRATKVLQHLEQEAARAGASDV